ncbi:MAG TPA: FAD-dependent thymidylate synthase [Firmicutes bacterium]|nr:FAD-dependent thymidylate synthase [Bacillota bacterium]
MEPTVKLINYTKEPERVIAAAARLCYSERSGEDLFENLSDEEVKKLVKNILNLGHYSVLEHVSFTFSISGISRVTTHQLVRHRVGCSYSQRSQRYIKEDNFDYIIPPSIQERPELLEKYNETMENLNNLYEEFAQVVPKEDARYLLPQAIESKIMVTYSLRALLHFIKLRTCRRAQWEIQTLAWKMLKEAKQVAPLLLENVGPACLNGNCPEGKLSCGRPYTKEDIDSLII